MRNPGVPAAALLAGGILILVGVWRVVPWSAPMTTGAEVAIAAARVRPLASNRAPEPGGAPPFRPLAASWLTLQVGLSGDRAGLPPVLPLRLVNGLLLLTLAVLAGSLSWRLGSSLGPALLSALVVVTCPLGLTAVLRVEAQGLLLGTVLLLMALLLWERSAARTGLGGLGLAVLALVTTGAAALAHELTLGAFLGIFGLLWAADPRQPRRALAFATPAILLALVWPLLWAAAHPGIDLARLLPGIAPCRASLLVLELGRGGIAAAAVLGLAVMGLGIARRRHREGRSLVAAGFLAAGAVLPWLLLDDRWAEGRPPIAAGQLVVLAPALGVAAGALPLNLARPGRRRRGVLVGLALALAGAGLWSSSRLLSTIHVGARLRAFVLAEAAAASNQLPPEAQVVLVGDHSPEVGPADPARHRACDALGPDLGTAFALRFPSTRHRLVHVLPEQLEEATPGDLEAIAFRPEGDAVLWVVARDTAPGFAVDRIDAIVRQRSQPSSQVEGNRIRLTWDFRQSFQAHAWHGHPGGAFPFASLKWNGSTAGGAPSYLGRGPEPAGFLSPPLDPPLLAALEGLEIAGAVLGRPSRSPAAPPGPYVVLLDERGAELGTLQGSTPIPPPPGETVAIPLTSLPRHSPGPGGGKTYLALIPALSPCELAVERVSLIFRREKPR